MTASSKSVSVRKDQLYTVAYEEFITWCQAFKIAMLPKLDEKAQETIHIKY